MKSSLASIQTQQPADSKEMKQLRIRALNENALAIIELQKVPDMAKRKTIEDEAKLQLFGKVKA